MKVKDKTCYYCKDPIKETEISPSSKYLTKRLDKLQVTCNNCYKDVLHDDILNHVNKVCKFACIYGCTQKLERCQMSVHYFTCDNIEKPCPGVELGCLETGKDLKKHLPTCVHYALLKPIQVITHKQDDTCKVILDNFQTLMKDYTNDITTTNVTLIMDITKKWFKSCEDEYFNPLTENSIKTLNSIMDLNLNMNKLQKTVSKLKQAMKSHTAKHKKKGYSKDSSAGSHEDTECVLKKEEKGTEKSLHLKTDKIDGTDKNPFPDYRDLSIDDLNKVGATKRPSVETPLHNIPVLKEVPTPLLGTVKDLTENVGNVGDTNDTEDIQDDADNSSSHAKHFLQDTFKNAKCTDCNKTAQLIVRHRTNSTTINLYPMCKVCCKMSNFPTQQVYTLT